MGYEHVNGCTNKGRSLLARKGVNYVEIKEGLLESFVLRSLSRIQRLVICKRESTKALISANTEAEEAKAAADVAKKQICSTVYWVQKVQRVRGLRKEAKALVIAARLTFPDSCNKLPLPQYATEPLKLSEDLPLVSA